MVTAITLIVAFGIISIGCMSMGKPSNDDIKKAIIAYEISRGVNLNQENIEIKEVGGYKMIPGMAGTISYYPVKVSIIGSETWFRLQKNKSGAWIALPLVSGY